MISVTWRYWLGCTLGYGSAVSLASAFSLPLIADQPPGGIGASPSILRFISTERRSSVVFCSNRGRWVDGSSCCGRSVAAAAWFRTLPLGVFACELVAGRLGSDSGCATDILSGADIPPVALAAGDPPSANVSFSGTDASGLPPTIKGTCIGLVSSGGSVSGEPSSSTST